ncbi:MAG: Hsp20/alpha crystallin family protein [Gammaproteobacteria bacterium]
MARWFSTTKPVNINRKYGSRFSSLQHTFDKFMEDFSNIFEATNVPENFTNCNISPDIDILEDHETFKIEAQVPGTDEKDFEITIRDHQLIISGEKHYSKTDENKNYIMREINYGSYQRCIDLPDYIDTEKACASFKKGMLWITIPKKKENIGQEQRLTIERAE